MGFHPGSAMAPLVQVIYKTAFGVLVNILHWLLIFNYPLNQGANIISPTDFFLIGYIWTKADIDLFIACTTTCVVTC